jgi:8-oxo-dGTP pyrophosphatase MutT (NUDIX family)
MKQVGKSKRTEKATRPGKAKPGAKKRRMDTAPGRQYAALPFRYLDGLEIMLISSRETRRWVIPKGWPMKGRKPHVAAAREARQEAGLVGLIAKRSVGSYQYVKMLKNGAPLQCTVDVFPMMVQRQRARWREQHQRVARWFTPEEAAAAVDEPELQALIEDFARPGGAPPSGRGQDMEDSVLTE